MGNKGKKTFRESRIRHRTNRDLNQLSTEGSEPSWERPDIPETSSYNALDRGSVPVEKTLFSKLGDTFKTLAIAFAIIAPILAVGGWANNIHGRISGNEKDLNKVTELADSNRKEITSLRISDVSIEKDVAHIQSQLKTKNASSRNTEADPEPKNNK